MELKLLNNLISSAKSVYPEYPILQKLVVTQGILESGFLRKSGGSTLALRYNNLFGIKARLDAAGKPIEPAVALSTWEHIKGRDIQVKAYFAVYKDHEACFKRHRELMLKPRYKQVLKSKTIEDACKYIRVCGWATDVNYTRKLLDIYTSVVGPNWPKNERP